MKFHLGVSLFQEMSLRVLEQLSRSLPSHNISQGQELTWGSRSVSCVGYTHVRSLAFDFIFTSTPRWRPWKLTRDLSLLESYVNRTLCRFLSPGTETEPKRQPHPWICYWCLHEPELQVWNLSRIPQVSPKSSSFPSIDNSCALVFFLYGCSQKDCSQEDAMRWLPSCGQMSGGLLGSGYHQCFLPLSTQRLSMLLYSSASQLPFFFFRGPHGSSPSHPCSCFHLQCESLVTIKWLRVRTPCELWMCMKDWYVFFFTLPAYWVGNGKFSPETKRFQVSTSEVKEIFLMFQPILLPRKCSQTQCAGVWSLTRHLPAYPTLRRCFPYCSILIGGIPKREEL